MEAQAEALIALDDADADAGLDAGARVVDVADFDRFASAEMKQEADDIIAPMMKYENVGASGLGGAAARETSSDEVAAALADDALEVVGAECAGRRRRRAQGADEEARRGLEKWRRRGETSLRKT